ncbi:MAG: orotidine-5'-phosphate decarboxylase [Deltaproteobacteria bacterium]|nr:orotidine-5'-phosphate decarboxylase [Deltaproteobacteria bacterium]
MSRKTGARQKLVVALDGDSLVRAQEMVELLRGDVVNFEVGIELFTACGPGVIEMIREAECQVFLDLKYHDIPSTVAKAVACATRLGVALLNIHASGGARMMEEARNAVAQAAGTTPPKLIAATVLTSMESLGDIGVQFEVREQVVRLAQLARDMGMDGVNASPLEIQMIRQTCGEHFLIVTPGIRMAGERPDDQRRIGHPRQAIEAGADYLVVGRPITEAPDPRAVVKAILRDIG